MPTFPEPRARALFQDALELPEDARAAFLAEKCGRDFALRREIETLLLAHAGACGTLVESADQVGEQAGQRIGRYKLLQKIGEGGFGTVWMAEQEEPVRRKVALKVLKAGMDTAQVIGRFEAERQALALMDHPNIAKVFDGGATPKGRPYFVMELVKGVPITEYCDSSKLLPDERLELFVPVCRAVQHAHQKGVIHRDLKPSNVLVTLHDGVPVPKVIDFGIAKATSAALTERTVFTEFRQMLGTPEYMAPEQAELSGLDVDTRADIYSLGVLLYELLTGTRPFELKTLLEKGYAEMLRTIREVDPPKPSTRISTLGEAGQHVAHQRGVRPRALSLLMRGDLDWIVMKALEKDRARRYETVSALAEDLQRHLRHETVLAGPPSQAYRLRKFVRRNRLRVAAGAGIAASLLVGAVAAGLGYMEATEQARLAGMAEDKAKGEREIAMRAKAEEERQKKAALAAQAEAEAQQKVALSAQAKEREQRELAERNAEEKRREAAKATHVVELLQKLLASSDPYEKKGKDYTVRQLLDDFAQGIEGQLTDEPDVQATLRRVIGQCYLQLGLPQNGELHLARAVALTRETHGEASLELADHEIELATCWREAGRFDDALSLQRAVLSRLTGDSPSERQKRASCLGRMAYTLAQRRQPGDLEEAEKLVRQGIEIEPDTPGKDLCESLSYLFEILCETNQFEKAQAAAEEILALDLAQHGDDSLQVANAKCNLALALEKRGGDLARAEQLLREALAVRKRHLGGDHVEVEHSLNNLASTLLARGDLEGALALFTEARDLRRRISGEHVRGAMLQQNIAMTLQRMRRFEEAKTAQEEAIAMRRRLHGGDHPDLANALSCLGDVLKYGIGTAAAEPQYLEAIAMYRRLGMAADPRCSYAMVGAAEVILDQGRPAEAEPLARAAAARLSELPFVGADHRIRALRTLGLALLDQKQAAPAEVPLSKALELSRQAFRQPHLEVGYSLSAFGEAMEAKGDLASAEEHYRQAVAMWRTLDASELRPGVEDLERLARVLAAQGKSQEATSALRAVLRARRKNIEQQPLLVARTLSALGGALHGMRQLAEAEEAQREALKLLEAHGPKNKNLAAATYLTNLGRTLAAEGKHGEAEATLERAREMFVSVQAADHPNYAFCLSHLAEVRAARQDYASSLAFGQQALDLRRKQIGSAHPEIASRLAAVTSLLLNAGRAADALPLARDSLRILEVKLPGSAQHRQAQALLGRVLAICGEAAEAEHLLVEACGKLEASADSLDGLRAALRALIDLYRRQGKAKDAEAWEGKLRGLDANEPRRDR